MLRTLRNRAKRDNDPRILILGLDNAGKTTVLKKLCETDSSSVVPVAPEGPTQGFNIKTLSVGGRNAKMCDLGGQRSLREYWQDYYETTDCLMYVVDATDSRRLQEAHETFKEVVAAVPKLPVLVFANKQDLKTAKTPQVVAEILELVECVT